MSEPPKPEPKPGHIKVVRALYHYKAQRGDELSFQEGDVLYVYDQVTDPDWWKARCGMKCGVIPSNYVESQTECMETPLHEAARRGNLNFLRECLQNGVSSTGLDSVGNTALYWAARSGHLQCLTHLLALPNPPLNAQNRVGETALHAAAEQGNVEAVGLLLEGGADPGLQNREGETAEQLASSPAVINVLQLKAKGPAGTGGKATYRPDEYGGDSE